MMLQAEENQDMLQQVQVLCFDDDSSFDESDSIDIEKLFEILEEDDNNNNNNIDENRVGSTTMGSSGGLSYQISDEPKSVEFDYGSLYLQSGVQDFTAAPQIRDHLQESSSWFGSNKVSECLNSTEGEGSRILFDTEKYSEPVYCNVNTNSFVNQNTGYQTTLNSSTEHISNCIDSSCFSYPEIENRIGEQFANASYQEIENRIDEQTTSTVEDLSSKCDSNGVIVGGSGLSPESYFATSGSSVEGRSQESNQFLDDLHLPDASDQVSDILSGIGNHYSPGVVCGNSSVGADSGNFSPSGLLRPDGFDRSVPPGSQTMTIVKKNGFKFIISRNKCARSKTDSGSGLTVPDVISTKTVSTIPTGMSKSSFGNFKPEGSGQCYQLEGSTSFSANERHVVADSSRKLKPHIHPYKLTKSEVTSASDCLKVKFPISEVTNFFSADSVSNYPNIPSLTSNKMLELKDIVSGTFLPSRNEYYQSESVGGEFIDQNSSKYAVDEDDDADLCILEDISGPRQPPSQKSIFFSHHSAVSNTVSDTAVCDTIIHTGMSGARLKTSEEALTFRLAMQDLSQPKSEAKLPEGVLTIDLLRHQRIALSWMVQKETSSIHCSGGILADDQGLGKTISTIALILKERPPLSKLGSISVKQEEMKSFNLDEDDNEVDKVERNLVVAENAYTLTKGRPAAGTLVVCPTSVLRQWADELTNKVSKEAGLTVLVYHGSNRTKNHLELASYDVVLTTYSIVTTEVPKQPLNEKDDDVKLKPEGHDSSGIEPSSNKKRKYPPSSIKKNQNDKKGLNRTLLESGARPLARVGWFRVVLDEAQSIKNHRTQCARACWGLRAKRRWCLSGTPIQNAVDDLYSYFRFLRYDPYAVYKSFCSMIKAPIGRNSTNGYKKLQAVLKTIMLRRTKGTKIDGEPIINLPPKSIELRKVEFSYEERDFYSKLEADSRAQFKVYAAAGTVKQNYVNILLMLLRLRQACDHPLLVRGYDSNSVWKASVEMAKNLPRERQINLLNHLESCVVLCGICNDPPEDAVVTICEHVFCNQCMCEHLTGDDNICPVVECQVHLCPTSVFSIGALKTALSDQPGPDCFFEKTSQIIEAPGPLLEKRILSSAVVKSESRSESSFESSKIKAALEVLQALSKRSDGYSEGDFLETGESKHASHSNRHVSEKAIVFSQWTRMLDLLEAHLKSSSIQYRRLDGTMSIAARDKAVKDFNTLPEVSVMIMSLKAASLGLNMVAACHVILLDLWWNPTTEDQAIDRAHRIGQKRPVTVVRLTVKDTVEDRILALQQKKRLMVASAFGEDETGGRATRLTVDDLKYLFME